MNKSFEKAMKKHRKFIRGGHVEIAVGEVKVPCKVEELRRGVRKAIEKALERLPPED